MPYHWTPHHKPYPIILLTLPSSLHLAQNTSQVFDTFLMTSIHNLIQIVPTLLSNPPFMAQKRFMLILSAENSPFAWTTLQNFYVLHMKVAPMMTSFLLLSSPVASMLAIGQVSWSRRMKILCSTGKRSSNVPLFSSGMAMHSTVCPITRLILSTVGQTSFSEDRKLLIHSPY